MRWFMSIVGLWLGASLAMASPVLDATDAAGFGAAYDAASFTPTFTDVARPFDGPYSGTRGEEKTVVGDDGAELTATGRFFEPGGSSAQVLPTGVAVGTELSRVEILFTADVSSGGFVYNTGFHTGLIELTVELLAADGSVLSSGVFTDSGSGDFYVLVGADDASAFRGFALSGLQSTSQVRDFFGDAVGGAAPEPSGEALLLALALGGGLLAATRRLLG